MPFKSEAQRRYLWAKHPEIARKWADKYGSKPQSAGDIKKAARKRLLKYGRTK
jgi:hypothetical protein